MVSVVVNLGLPANYFVAVPPAVVTFINLALVALRNDRRLQAFSLAFIVVVLVVLFAVAPRPHSGLRTRLVVPPSQSREWRPQAVMSDGKGAPAAASG
jgi:hypothetical protein